MMRAKNDAIYRKAVMSHSSVLTMFMFAGSNRFMCGKIGI